MADRTVITIQRLNTPEGETISFQSIDATNGMEYSNSGREIILVQTGAGETTDVLIDSRADAFGREGDLTDLNIGASKIRAYGPLTPPDNWGDGAKAEIDFANVTGTPKIAVILT